MGVVSVFRLYRKQKAERQATEEITPKTENEGENDENSMG